MTYSELLKYSNTIVLRIKIPVKITPHIIQYFWRSIFYNMQTFFEIRILHQKYYISLITFKMCANNIIVIRKRLIFLFYDNIKYLSIIIAMLSTFAIGPKQAQKATKTIFSVYQKDKIVYMMIDIKPENCIFVPAFSVVLS